MMADVTMTIEDFLRARIATRAAAARLCAETFPTPWEIADRGWRVRIYSAPVPDTGDHAEPGWERVPVVMEVEPDRHIEDPRWLSERVEHVMINDPDYVLADCEAKEAIVGMHGAMLVDFLSGPALCCDLCDDPYPCRTLRLLATPDAGHSDYRQEWKP